MRKARTDPDGKRIMLSAHMDHIGFIVVAVEKEGFLRVMPVGGVGLAVSRTVTSASKTACRA